VVPHGIGVRAQPADGVGAQVGEPLDELREVSGAQTEQVVPDQHLAVGGTAPIPMTTLYPGLAVSRAAKSL
jgi:hypothetical protein